MGTPMTLGLEERGARAMADAKGAVTTASATSVEEDFMVKVLAVARIVRL